MVEYHDQMVLMMDSDLTDLTMLRDKTTLQASDLMPREHGETTLDLTQAPDPILEFQDPILEFQDPMPESQDLILGFLGRILESQDQTLDFQDPMPQFQDLPLGSQDLILESQDPILDPQDLTLEFLDPMLEFQDPIMLDLDQITHPDQIQALDRIMEVQDPMVLEVQDPMFLMEESEPMLEVQDPMFLMEESDPMLEVLGLMLVVLVVLDPMFLMKDSDLMLEVPDQMQDHSMKVQGKTEEDKLETTPGDSDLTQQDHPATLLAEDQVDHSVLGVHQETPMEGGLLEAQDPEMATMEAIMEAIMVAIMEADLHLMLSEQEDL